MNQGSDFGNADSELEAFGRGLSLHLRRGISDISYTFNG